jgi:hypothetical protein
MCNRGGGGISAQVSTETIQTGTVRGGGIRKWDPAFGLQCNHSNENLLETIRNNPALEEEVCVDS